MSDKKRIKGKQLQIHLDQHEQTSHIATTATTKKRKSCHWQPQGLWKPPFSCAWFCNRSNKKQQTKRRSTTAQAKRLPAFLLQDNYKCSFSVYIPKMINRFSLSRPSWTKFKPLTGFVSYKKRALIHVCCHCWSSVIRSDLKCAIQPHWFQFTTDCNEWIVAFFFHQ